MAKVDTQENSNPTPANIIRRFMDRVLRTSVFTTMPGVVVSYDPDAGRAAIQPLIKIPVEGAIIDDETTEADLMEDLPVLPDVRIQFLRSKTATVRIPVEPGTVVAIFFSTYSLEKFFESDGATPVDPQDTRHHDLSDAFAIPGLNPFGDTVGDMVADAIQIIHDPEDGVRTELRLNANGTINIVGTGEVRIEADGTIRIIPATGKDVILGSETATEKNVLGNVFLALYNAHTHPTGVGPSGAPVIPMTVPDHLSPNVKSNGPA